MKHSCDYKKVNENNDGILEICQICKKRLVTKKDPKTGRIDNKRYIEAHIKDGNCLFYNFSNKKSN